MAQKMVRKIVRKRSENGKNIRKMSAKRAKTIFLKIENRKNKER